MMGSDLEGDTEKSPLAKRLGGSGKNSRNGKKKKGVHDISDNSSEEERTVFEKPAGGGFSASQMKELTTMISAMMGSAFAQARTAHALGALPLPPKSIQNGSDLSGEQHESSEEKEPDGIDDYDKSWKISAVTRKLLDHK